MTTFVVSGTFPNRLKSDFLAKCRFPPAHFPLTTRARLSKKQLTSLIRPEISGCSTTFENDYNSNLPLWLIPKLKSLGFHHPTPVQEQVLRVALPSGMTNGSDVVIHAQTGSGKTLAYLLPLIAAVDPSRACIQALVIVPTQELGMQVYKLVRQLVSAYGYNDKRTKDRTATDSPPSRQSSFPVLPMLNQADLRRQKLQLKQTAPRVIVGNPHRIASLVESGRLRLDLLRVLVVDEFDACLSDTTTVQALQTILSVKSREQPRQTILASATVPQHRHFLRQCVRQRWTQPTIKHVWIEGKKGKRVPPSLTHSYAVCDGRKKLAALRRLILNAHDGEHISQHINGLAVKGIVFVMPSRSVQEITQALNKTLNRHFGVQNVEFAVGLTNDMPIVIRRESMRKFRKGDVNILISTDMAARGLDVPDLSHVFHFDLPTGTDSYLHRAGRSGRRGKNGNSIVIITPGEEFVINRTANTLGINFLRVKS